MLFRGETDGAPSRREHRGRTFKLMGDGLLAEFASAVDAVNAAVAIQQALVEWNKSLPQDRPMIFRIGINLCDVVVNGDDIHGDGANVAARLEKRKRCAATWASAIYWEAVSARPAIGFESRRS